MWDTIMGLLKWLLGETSTPLSLEEKLALAATIEERKKQARDRGIHWKAIDVVQELGEVDDSSRVSPPRISLKGHYQDTIIRITYSFLCFLHEYQDPSTDDESTGSWHRDLKEQLELKIHFNRNICYSQKNSNATSCEYYGKEKEGALRSYCTVRRSTYPDDYIRYETGGISTYIPGDWEAHLDELYERVGQVKTEKQAREAEEKVKREQQAKQEEQERRLSGIESKKKNFGLE